jgi:uncharacterized protein YbjT (DUF2867 family)
MTEILLTGATGNVGKEIAAILKKNGVPFRAAVRELSEAGSLGSTESVRFDFEDPSTFENAFRGIRRVYLMRPPAISDPKVIRPAIEAGMRAGVEQFVFLSLLGAEKNQVVPHRKIEELLLECKAGYTFLRPGFFMQNLSTTHAPEIRDQDEIWVPAGKGSTSFIDAQDIAAVAAKCLTEEGHLGKAYALTGSEALTYAQVAALLTQVLGRKIQYRNPSILRFAWHMRRRRGFPWAFIGVMVGIYTVAKIGRAGTLTQELRQLLGRDPVRMKEFLEKNRGVWERKSA